MSFVDVFNRLPEERPATVERFAGLVAERTDEELETMAQRSAAITREKFGNTMRLFAPLYLPMSV